MSDGEWVPARTCFDMPFQIGNVAESIAGRHFAKLGLDVRTIKDGGAKGSGGQGDFLVLNHAAEKMAIIEVKGSTGDFQSEKKRLASGRNGPSWFYLVLHVKLDPSNLSRGLLNRGDLDAIYLRLGLNSNGFFAEKVTS